MSGQGWTSLAVYVGLLLLLAVPLGGWMARVFEGRPCGLDFILLPLERRIYRICRIDSHFDQPWRSYAGAFLSFNLVGFLTVYGMQRLQAFLPLNPTEMGPVRADSAFNTAVSFASNTNWQGYAGEATMSHFTQMAGLGVQNFVSAASGMACMLALIRGLTRRSAAGIGNFWSDLVRSTLYVLLPLSLILAVFLVGEGVVQSFEGSATATLLDPLVTDDGTTISEQVIPLGPVASQVAIKQLGTNGGGFFNANSAHPLENPTPASSLAQCLAILLIPAGLCITFGRMVGAPREGRLLLAVMLTIFLPCLIGTAWAESRGTPWLAPAGAEATGTTIATGGNLEGKEVRFGIAGSAAWAVATTAASNGSVNAMHDSFTPLGGLFPMFLMQLGEVVFGGVGSGLYGLVVFVLVAVFLAGLMIGRTPSWLGKRIEAFEMKMAAVVILAPCLVVLGGTALAVSTGTGRYSIANPSAHGFSEVLYAFSSAGNNNGSAFAGLAADTPFYNAALGLAMLVGRYVLSVAILAIAGSLAAKKLVPAGPGTLRTDTWLFGSVVTMVVLIVGGLTFFPALALGPIVEHLEMVR